ncbi:thiol:disulfide interchange protein DsbA/DsbL [Thalassolituus sp. C2-1]|jgi:thiol:disulfide interchange protein DsbA|uniref:thiol:disulfide interchange protein DsbA/DsbL n=1 Tax=Venatorbacter sp. C2-1 TaxID=2597518 RepID=UPI0011935DE5|nr:thiol:disulfide interchange protein DsbA/DsbL [Thalassolituus sp. C2-1]MBU2039774.1 thiol:disulfide interchange protein DsbA/DsbL [Gammaproteobacteria bacterium]TVV44706.1 thiol:disulfide interchange protein DsbA/DsbL [Thalassolituus sp. C2-1]|tara:strand:- start:12 stop:653 length:642 start_codon:yes stop_codon:yes gene_type:complete
MLSQVTKWMAAAVLLISASAQAAEYEAGKEYKVLAEPVPVLADGKVHVEEAFWYGCPHCFHLEDIITPWKKNLPADVAFEGVPAMFGRAWVSHAQFYYVADVLGVLDQVHGDIFKAIHVERQRLLDRDDQRDFLVAKAGVKAADFDKAYESFTVKSRMKQGDQRIRAFQISGVPALIVQGKYIIDATSAGGQDKMLDVADYLIAKERAALSGK